MLPERESRPAGEARAAQSSAGASDSTIVAEPTLQPGVAARRAWNAERRAGAAAEANVRTWPAYGSREWLALPEESPLRWCGVLLAAECWARAGDELEASLRAEVALAAKAHKANEDADYVARRDAHRAEFGGLKLARGAFADSDEFGRRA